MAECKWHSNRIAPHHATAVMAGVDEPMKAGTLPLHSSKMQTPSSALYDHQKNYQAYLNQIIKSAQKHSGEQIFKVEGDQAGSLNFKVLLEHAMAGMKRDWDSFSALENNVNATSQKHDSFMKDDDLCSSPPRKKQSRDHTAQRPPALAATHPNHYHQKSQKQKTMWTAHQQEFKFQPKLEEEQKPWSLPEPEAPWHMILDPSYQTSREPACDHPMFRTLNTDTNPDHPNILSPTFMIALPCGTLVEGANYYPPTGAKEAQPRDAPSA